MTDYESTTLKKLFFSGREDISSASNNGLNVQINLPVDMPNTTYKVNLTVRQDLVAGNSAAVIWVSSQEDGRFTAQARQESGLGWNASMGDYEIFWEVWL